MPGPGVPVKDVRRDDDEYREEDGHSRKDIGDDIDDLRSDMQSCQLLNVQTHAVQFKGVQARGVVEMVGACRFRRKPIERDRRAHRGDVGRLFPVSARAIYTSSYAGARPKPMKNE